MKKVLKWIVFGWSVLAIPFLFEAGDFIDVFFSTLYTGLVIGLMIDDLRKSK